eukprot:INCI9188.4.p1 GENE.INCI9188.4~~INCI9188.4.p1  ORF type:complete len:333 (-),score=24.90 INCI9188.4:1321-2319(-)
MSSTHRVTSFAARSHFMSAEGSSGAPQERRRSKGRLRKARNQHRGTLVPHKVQAHFASQQTSPGGTVRPSTAQTASGLTSNPAAGTLRGGVGNSLRHPQHRNRGKRSVGLPAAPFVYSYNPRDFSSCISGQTVGKPTASTSALRPRDSSADFGDHPQQPGLNQQQHLPNLGQSSARELLNTVFRDNTWLPAERAELKNSLSNFNHDSRTTARQNPTGSGGMLFANARAGQLATIVNSQNNPSSLTHRIGPRPATAQTARAGFPASAQAQTQSDSREVDPGIAGVDSPGDATGSKLERKAPERGLSHIFTWQHISRLKSCRCCTHLHRVANAV